MKWKGGAEKADGNWAGVASRIIPAESKLPSCPSPTPQVNRVQSQQNEKPDLNNVPQKKRHRGSVCKSPRTASG